MQYQQLLPSQQYIPVVQQYSGGSPLGAILAVAGLKTNQGTVQGFDANNNIIVTSALAPSGIVNLASGIFYGFQLECLQTDAQAKGWPGNQSDVQYQGHTSSTFIFPSGYLPNH